MTVRIGCLSMTQSLTWKRRKDVMKSSRSNYCREKQIVGTSGVEPFEARRGGWCQVINIISITARTCNSVARTSSGVGQNSKRKLPHLGDPELDQEQFQSVSAWLSKLSGLMDFLRA